jgi:hypothetical protein
MNFKFEEFVNTSFDCFCLREGPMDFGGGTIKVSNIDSLQFYPDPDTVQVSGLNQASFEYFIKRYGSQLKAIRFFKNKFVEDWSLLGSLPQLEYVYFYYNQRITSLWDMSGNTSLTGLCIQDLSRLSTIEGIAKAPALETFIVGNAIDDKLVLDSLLPLAGSSVKRFSFEGKDIRDKDLSFLTKMNNIERFDFRSNLYTTEQVAWIAANYPGLSGRSIKPFVETECMDFKTGKKIASVWIVGKRKPLLAVEGNEEKINRYAARFEALKQEYVGKEYREAFAKE